MSSDFTKFAGPYGGPLLLTLCVLLACVFEPASGEWLAYDRYAIEGFETWRLLTANIVHTNGWHALLNLAGLTLLTFLHSDHYRFMRFIKLFLWCSLLTSTGIYYFSPQLIWYAGLSGALHGVFLWGACMDIRSGLKSGWLLACGVVAKIVYEQINGGSADVEALIGAAVATDAHLYGAVAGLLMFLLMIIPVNKRRPAVQH